MPTYTMGLMTVRVLDNRTGQAEQLDAFAGGRDLHVEWPKFLDSLVQQRGHARRETYLLPVDVGTPSGTRDVRAALDYGRFGTARRIREVTSGAHVGDVRTSQVAGDETRSVLRVPVASRTALLAYEAIGTSSHVGLLSHAAKGWFQQQFRGSRLEIEYLPDTDAWNDYLDGAALKGVVFTRFTDGGDRAAPRRTERFEVGAPRGGGLPARWLERARRARLRPSDVLTVNVPDDMDDTKIVVSKDGRKRTFHVGDAWPRFTWEIEPGSRERPVGTVFYGFVDEIMSERIDDL